ncbi:MAG: LCP family protein [Geodermatophilaceae bacterium]|nr:LCP family protein [Geodermatophilaceae bacterium]
MIVVLISGLFLGLGAVGVFWFFTERYLGNIDRIADPFQGIDESSRPPAPEPVSGQTPVTFLLVGSDSRDPSGEGPPGDRSDVIMIMRITGERQLVQFISIPRDSWVPIPGRGLNKINASYSFGGPTLLIQTVEQLTGIRIDHFAAIDFAGFKEITDALGGVDVRVAETTSQGGVTFHQGVNHLNGTQALIYVRQRHGLPGGDLDRVQRQQNYLRAVMGTVFQQNMLGDLGKTDDLLLSLTNVISVDDTLTSADMLGLAYSMRDLKQNSLSFLTVPVAGLGREGAASVVYLDTAQAAPMWAYLQSDTLADHLAEFDEDLLPDNPY